MIPIIFVTEGVVTEKSTGMIVLYLDQVRENVCPHCMEECLTEGRCDHCMIDWKNDSKQAILERLEEYYEEG